LPSHLPQAVQDAVHKSTFATPDLTKLDDATRNHVLNAYASASRSVFIMLVASIGTCLLLMVFVKDRGLKRQEDVQEVEVQIEEGEPMEATDEKEDDKSREKSIGAETPIKA
jgi:hypothetical protein